MVLEERRFAAGDSKRLLIAENYRLNSGFNSKFTAKRPNERSKLAKSYLAVYLGHLTRFSVPLHLNPKICGDRLNIKTTEARILETS